MNTVRDRSASSQGRGFRCLFVVALLIPFLGSVATASAVNHRPKLIWESTGSGGTTGPDQELTTGTFSDEVYSVTDVDTPSSITLTIDSSSNPTWCPTTNLSVTGSLPNLTVHFATQPSGNGVATITLKATDGGSPSNFVVTSFTIQKISSLTNVPKISAIPDQTIPNSGVTNVLNFITDSKTITISATSSNTTLVPIDTTHITTTDLNRTHTIKITPVASTTGYTTITVSDSATAPKKTTSFTVMVAGTGAPYFTSLGRYQVGTLPVTPTAFNFTVNDDGSTSNLTLSATSSNALLVPNTTTNLALGGSGSSRSITVTPATGQYGASTITLAVSDTNLTTYSQFLYVVQDPNDASMTFSRSKGVFVLDSPTCSPDCSRDGNPTCHSYTPSTWTNTYCIDLRDDSIRPDGIHTGDYGFVDGYTLRVPWNYIENDTVAGQYDFKMIDNALSNLPSGQSLSIIFIGQPSYIALHSGTVTWTPTVGDTTPRPVPWDSYLEQRWSALLDAMAAHVGPASVPLSQDLRIAVLDPSMPGADSGIRDPDPVVNFVNMSTYTKENLLSATEYYLSTLQDHFPGRHVQIGFWTLTDETPPVSLTEYIRGALLGLFDGVIRPRVGFWQEDLAATRLSIAPEYTASPSAYTSTPVASFATPEYESENVTWTAFQTLDSWAALFNDGHFDKMVNGSANDGYESAYQPYSSTIGRGYKTQYIETYAADVDLAAQSTSSALYRWHDYFATLNPIESPAGLTVSLTSSTSNTISWDAVFGATSYALVRTPLPSGSPTTFLGLTSTSYLDTGLTSTVAYAYRVLATNGFGSSGYSPSVAVFRSQSGNDGYVSASTTSSTGMGAGGIRAGQSSTAVGQIKGIVSFSTADLPDTSTILSAVLREEQGSTDITALGPCTVEIKNGAFNSNVALEAADFSASSTASVGQLPKVGANAWAELDLGSYLADINITGTTIATTQFRQSFAAYGTANTYMSWYPGDSVGNEPQLVVRYNP